MPRTEAVSILTRPEGRVLHRYARKDPDSSLVSILTRPEGRVLLIRVVRPLFPRYSFNPHPTRRPGATTCFFCDPPYTTGFNPHPTRRPGATHFMALLTLSFVGFNPHPTRRPGATYWLCLSGPG